MDWVDRLCVLGGDVERGKFPPVGQVSLNSRQFVKFVSKVFHHRARPGFPHQLRPRREEIEIIRVKRIKV